MSPEPYYRDENRRRHGCCPSCACPPDRFEIVGVGEAAYILGVSKQRVYQLAGSATSGMPEPVARLKATPVWSKAAIEDYATRRAGAWGRHTQ